MSAAGIVFCFGLSSSVNETARASLLLSCEGYDVSIKHVVALSSRSCSAEGKPGARGKP